MQTLCSSPLPDNGPQTDGVNAPKIFLVLVALVVLGAVGTYGVKAIQEARARAEEDRVTQELCRIWTGKILAAAKKDQPEEGTYEADLPIEDSWGQPLTSILNVGELSNFARVHSNGRDMIADNEDDHVFSKTDVHVRKSILAGLAAGSHSVGKGITTGVIDGLAEAKDASLKKAKEGAAKVKTSLMSRFKKKGTE